MGAAGAAIFCFLPSSLLRMAMASYMAAASEMRCVWCTTYERALQREVPYLVRSDAPSARALLLLFASVALAVFVTRSFELR